MGIGYLCDSGSPYILWSDKSWSAKHFEGSVGSRLDGDRLLKEPEKELAPAPRFPPVEAKGEFVQIIAMFHDERLGNRTGRKNRVHTFRIGPGKFASLWSLVSRVMPSTVA
jgi:hypothetical protein